MDLTIHLTGPDENGDYWAWQTDRMGTLLVDAPTPHEALERFADALKMWLELEREVPNA